MSILAYDQFPPRPQSVFIDEDARRQLNQCDGTDEWVDEINAQGYSAAEQLMGDMDNPTTDHLSEGLFNAAWSLHSAARATFIQGAERAVGEHFTSPAVGVSGDARTLLDARIKSGEAEWTADVAEGVNQ